MKRLCSAITLGTLAMTAFGQDFLSMVVERSISTKEKAYFCSPPKLVMDLSVDSVVEIPNQPLFFVFGRSIINPQPQDYLDLAFHKGKSDFKLKPFFRIWNPAAGTAKEVSHKFEEMVQKFFMGELEWSNKPYVAYSPQDQDIAVPNSKVNNSTLFSKVDFLSETIKPLLRLPGANTWALSASPNQPLVVIYKLTRNKNASDLVDRYTEIDFYVCDSDLTTLRHGKDRLRGDVYFSTWSADGKSLLGKKKSAKTEGVTGNQEVVVLNTLTAKISSIPESTAKKTPSELELSLYSEPYKAKSGEATQSRSALWVGSRKDPSALPILISTDVTQYGWIANEQRIFFYVSEERLYSCEISEMSQEDFLKAKAEAELRTLMSTAKQVGLALMIYSSDMDDKVPSALGWQDSLRPYLKNDKLTEGFVYLMDGQDLKSIKDPATTEMGYIQSAAGRVVLYADSHVKVIRKP